MFSPATADHDADIDATAMLRLLLLLLLDKLVLLVLILVMQLTLLSKRETFNLTNRQCGSQITGKDGTRFEVSLIHK